MIAVASLWSGSPGADAGSETSNPWRMPADLMGMTLGEQPGMHARRRTFSATVTLDHADAEPLDAGLRTTSAGTSRRSERTCVDRNGERTSVCVRPAEVSRACRESLLLPDRTADAIGGMWL